jgi:hypothetical protein
LKDSDKKIANAGLPNQDSIHKSIVTEAEKIVLDDLFEREVSSIVDTQVKEVDVVGDVDIVGKGIGDVVSPLTLSPHTPPSISPDDTHTDNSSTVPHTGDKNTILDNTIVKAATATNPGKTLSKYPSTDKSTIKYELDKLLRNPFRDELAKVLANSPNDEDLAAFAKKSPDRWGQLIAILGRLAGYSDKLEVSGSFEYNVNELSDAQVHSKREKLLAKLQELPDIIDITSKRGGGENETPDI